MSDRRTPDAAERSAPADEAPREKEFHLWRLLAGLAGVIVALMIVAAIVNVLVLGW